MNPFVEDLGDDDASSLPLDLDAFIGGLTPRKLVAGLVRRAALKAAAEAHGGGEVGGGEQQKNALVVAESMASMPSSSRASGKRSDLSLPPPSPLLLDSIIREFER